ncbi:MAG TPA: hypothetical protein VFW17_08140 [Ktedonobacterales bacterium]|nr:hypothetical protein [Ktedonobacterales bacterium]
MRSLVLPRQRDAPPKHAADAAYLRWDIWRAWALANLAAEALGLGATLLIGILVFGGLESRVGIIPVALLGVILGALCEGSIVGSLQWMVLRRPLPEMRWREWSVATAVGAGIAWALGILTGEIMSSMFAQSSAEADQQVGIGLPMVLLLAAGMGIALGALLGAAQWTVLRNHVPRAGWWIPANAVAWAIGMALVFAGMSFIPDSGVVTPGIVVALLVFIVLAGTAVGAIHGLALIWLVRERDRAQLVA